jgi:hypothetical protein
MCPKLDQGICNICGIEPERISCAEPGLCTDGEWDDCRVYSQFFTAIHEVFSIPA